MSSGRTRAWWISFRGGEQVLRRGSCLSHALARYYGELLHAGVAEQSRWRHSDFRVRLADRSLWKAP